MRAKETKKILLEKARELAHSAPSKDDIEIQAAPELLDGIQNISNREIALEILSRNWSMANEIREAIRRVDEGTYGICQECDEEINPRRLNAIPWAKYCVTCQAMHDRESETYRMAA